MNKIFYKYIKNKQPSGEFSGLIIKVSLKLWVQFLNKMSKLTKKIVSTLQFTILFKA